MLIDVERNSEMSIHLLLRVKEKIYKVFNEFTALLQI